jgi:hypothetical protein
MSLTFQPNRAVYDAASGVLRFFASDGPLLVRCGVSKDALVALSEEPSEGPVILERIYERHRTRFQEIAKRKYRAKQIDKDGMIVVRRRDLVS